MRSLHLLLRCALGEACVATGSDAIERQRQLQQALEKVAELHLARVGAKLTKMSEEQASYIGVTPQGPFKGENYRY